MHIRQGARTRVFGTPFRQQSHLMRCASVAQGLWYACPFRVTHEASPMCFPHPAQLTQAVWYCFPQMSLVSSVIKDRAFLQPAQRTPEAVIVQVPAGRSCRQAGASAALCATPQGENMSLPGTAPGLVAVVVRCAAWQLPCKASSSAPTAELPLFLVH